MALALLALSIDCGDAGNLAAFWAAALGRGRSRRHARIGRHHARRRPGVHRPAAVVSSGSRAEDSQEPAAPRPHQQHLRGRVAAAGCARRVPDPRRHQGLHPLDNVRRPRRQRVRPHRRLRKDDAVYVRAQVLTNAEARLAPPCARRARAYTEQGVWRRGSMPGNRWPLAGRYKEPSQLTAAVVPRWAAVSAGPAGAGHDGRPPVVIVGEAPPSPGPCPAAGPAADRALASTGTGIHPQEI